MKDEYDFSQGEQGKFYYPDAIFHFPIYLEPDVNEFIAKLAETQNLDIQDLVNELLRNNMRLIENTAES